MTVAFAIHITMYLQQICFKIDRNWQKTPLLGCTAHNVTTSNLLAPLQDQNVMPIPV